MNAAASAILEAGNLRFRSPGPGLRASLGCFWSLQTTAATRLRGLPDGCCMLSVVSSSSQPPQCFLSGPQLVPTERAPIRGQLLFGVRLQPGVAFLLTGRPVHTFAGQRKRLSDLLREDAVRLEQHLARAGNLDGSFDVLEEFLLERLAGREIDSRVANALRLIEASAGQIRVAEMAEQCGVSLRHLTRLLRQWAGLSPKHLARVIRFQALRQRVEVSHGEGTAQAAAELGYFDQSHLTAETARLSGVTPGQIGKRHVADFSKTRCG